MSSGRIQRGSLPASQRRNRFSGTASRKLSSRSALTAACCRSSTLTPLPSSPAPGLLPERCDQLGGALGPAGALQMGGDGRQPLGERAVGEEVVDRAGQLPALVGVG